MSPFLEVAADAKSYSARPCFICGAPGRCRHREPEIEAALKAAEAARRDGGCGDQGCKLCLADFLLSKKAVEKAIAYDRDCNAMLTLGAALPNGWAKMGEDEREGHIRAVARGDL
jgi:hypothetical protein